MTVHFSIFTSSPAASVYPGRASISFSLPASMMVSPTRASPTSAQRQHDTTPLRLRLVGRNSWQSLRCSQDFSSPQHVTINFHVSFVPADSLTSTAGPCASCCLEADSLHKLYYKVAKSLDQAALWTDASCQILQC